MILDLLNAFAVQLQQPTLAFLIGGMVLAALGSKLDIPGAIYRFIVVVLLLKIGLGAGIAIRKSDPLALILPALAALAIGTLIVLAGRAILGHFTAVRTEDALATAGLFGAVSASTLAASMVILEEQDIAFEAWVPALYPFMDIPALILAIVLAQMHRQNGNGGAQVRIGDIIAASLRSPAISAMLLGVAIGLLARPDPVYASFYEPLFRGFLSILMLIMGIEAFSRLAELRRVAHVYLGYALIAPFAHGLLGFGLGVALHHLAGLSPGGVVLLAVMAASSSDISGPPTLRAAIPAANPAAYVGASTGIGTPVALLSIPIYIALAQAVMG
jgi:uncharacterized protein